MSTTHETDDIKQIGQILADQIQSLRTLLDVSTEQIQRPEGLAVIASKTVAVPVAEALIRQLFQLHNNVKRTGFSASELVEIRRKQVVDANLEDSDRQMLERGFENLSLLANVVSIELTAKAIELAYASDNLLQSTRILTDVRPLFSDDAQSIDRAVVAHTLRLRYDSAGIDHELSLALDSSDLHKLIEDCERALQKEKTAQERLCNAANVPSMRIED